MPGGLRAPVLAVALLLLGVAAVVVWRGASRSPEEGPAPSPAAQVAGAPAPGVPSAKPDGDAPPAPPSPPREEPSAAADDPLSALAEPNAWASVDLEAVRAAMPENLYWEMSAPTRDARMLRAREEERERWNAAWGKVLSNTASEEEVRAYYAHRHRLSTDYVEFASHLLNEYAEVLPERDVGLLELAIELHLARLEEIPRQLEDALERRRAHAAAREAWLEEQAAFEGTAPTP